jgi:hypothetical protein
MTPEIRRLLDVMLTDLRRLGCHRREPCGVHAEPQWTCGFCLANLLEGVEAALLASPADLPPTEARFPFGMNADDHASTCEILTTRDGWEADCTCGLSAPAVPPPVEPPPQDGLGISPQDWKHAALRLGEDLATVGPYNYYNFTPRRWLEWALDALKATPPAPQDARGRAHEDE